MNYNKTHFLNWYFNSGSDQEQKQTLLNLGQLAREELNETGFFKINVDDLFKECKEIYLEEFRKH